MTHDQECDLVNRAQLGSVVAFEQIVKHYQDRLLRFLMLRGLQQVDAEDAIQSTFVAAWQNLAGYRSKWRFSTWIYTIAQRNAVERKSIHLNTDTNTDLLNNSSFEQDPCLTEQLKHNVWAVARNQLEPLAFQALWLHHGEGFSGAEIARIMNHTTIWVRVTLHRARKQLREVFTDDNPKVEQHEHITP